MRQSKPQKWIHLMTFGELKANPNTFGDFQCALLLDKVKTHELMAMRMKSQPFSVMFSGKNWIISVIRWIYSLIRSTSSMLTDEISLGNWNEIYAILCLVQYECTATYWLYNKNTLFAFDWLWSSSIRLMHSLITTWSPISLESDEK